MLNAGGGVVEVVPVTKPAQPAIVARGTSNANNRNI